MANGVIPYRDIYEQKGPLLYFLYSLSYLVSNHTFFGVYLLETVAAAAFMQSIFHIVALYTDDAPYWVPVAIGAVIFASKSFTLGGCSVEELCLPLFSWSLYHLLRLIRNLSISKPHTLRLPLIMLSGLFAVCVFWMKYTLCGFYIGWIAIVFVWYLIIDGIIPAIKTILSFLLGAFAVTFPWLFFFYVHHALRDLWKVYFYNNIFLYSSFSGGLKNTLHQDMINFLHAMFNNLWYSVPVAAGMLWLMIAPKKRVSAVEKAGILITFGLMAAGIYIGGRAYAYYPLVLGVFTVFGIIPLLLLIKTLEKYIKGAARRFVPIICSAVLIVLCGVYAFCYSYNTYFFGVDKDVMVQYKFSKIMHELDDSPTLLNYGFMDEGFYTAANIKNIWCYMKKPLAKVRQFL